LDGPGGRSGLLLRWARRVINKGLGFSSLVCIAPVVDSSHLSVVLGCYRVVSESLGSLAVSNCPLLFQLLSFLRVFEVKGLPDLTAPRYLGLLCFDFCGSCRVLEITG
jgi:hypothetical protein